ncbi:MAG: ribose 5-phosphate isomerase B [Holosporales bacterium]|jgi:ribose 5-phosphate isomerase B|nr:ribose 5-phosphate isomerase B [Holosporales bacterium]
MRNICTSLLAVLLAGCSSFKIPRDPNLQIAIAADHGGVKLKEKIVKSLEDSGFKVVDYGTFNDKISVDYPDYAQKVARHVLHTKNSFGILICRSGIGMSIASNRFKNIRAALCLSPKMAKSAREHNDANIICFGADYSNLNSCLNCINIFINSKFQEGRHLKRINKIEQNFE